MGGANEEKLVSGFEGLVTETESLLQWYCAPDSWNSSATSDDAARREGKGGWFKVENKRLVVAAPSKKDFWRRTYYTPILVKDDGPCLFAMLNIMEKSPYMVTTSCTLNPKHQFDQGGICIRLDHEHWLKTGIEVVDDIPRLSCVVTNVCSDWSTQIWKEAGARIRVHIFPQNNSYVVEAAPLGKDEWTFIRIAHLSKGMQMIENSNKEEDHVSNKAWQGPSPPSGYLWAGVFACCPEDQSGSFVTFHELEIVRGSSFEHDADGNHE